MGLGEMLSVVDDGSVMECRRGVISMREVQMSYWNC